MGDMTGQVALVTGGARSAIGTTGTVIVTVSPIKRRTASV